MNVVEIRSVTKTFGQHTAVDDLSLRVPQGSIYGFIGPNGSGKTTTIRMIMRIYYPDSGSGGLSVFGEESSASATDRIGYLPEERGLYKRMKVRDVLRFYGELKGLRRPGPAIDQWLERMGLAAWANKRVDALSKGMAQKVQFISAVVAAPELVILDEPFSGLDPVNTDELRKAVLDLRQQGATVIFSTHDMAMAEQLCDFIFMIYRGRKVLDGTLDDIKSQYGQDIIHVAMAGRTGDLSGLPGVAGVNDLGRRQELRIQQGADTQAILAELLRRGTVNHFELARPSLHDIFVRIARPEPQEAARA